MTQQQGNIWRPYLKTSTSIGPVHDSAAGHVNNICKTSKPITSTEIWKSLNIKMHIKFTDIKNYLV